MEKSIVFLMVMFSLCVIYAEENHVEKGEGEEEIIEIDESETESENKDEEEIEKKQEVHSEKKNDEGEDFLEVDTEKEVVVTGTSTEKTIQKAPVKTSVISKEKMEVKNAANLADSLESNTGVRVENNCQNCGFNQVRLNGLDGHYNQILIDGNPVYSSLAGVYGLEHIPVEMIERVEIVKGGGSALYGGNAVAGVINVITRKPSRNTGNINVETQFMTEDGDNSPKKMLKLGGNVAVITPEKNAALYAYGGGVGRQPWDANGDGFSDLGEMRQVYGGAKGQLTLFKDSELTGKFDMIKESRRGGDRMSKAKHKSEVAEAVDTNRWTGDVKWEHEVKPGTDYTVSYDFAVTERHSYYGGDDPLGDMYGQTKNPLHVTNVKMNHLLPVPGFGAMMLTGGLEYSIEDLRDNDAEGKLFTDERYTNFGGFLQSDFQMTQWLALVSGGRIDKHSEVNKAIFSPRLALMLGDFNGFRSRTSFSTGFRAPQIFDEDFHITVVQGEPSPTFNSDDLHAEKSWNISQQFEYEIEPLEGFFLNPSVNGFYSRIKDAFATKNMNEDDELFEEGENRKIRYNSGKTTVMGLEVELKANYEKYLDFEAGWSFEKAENSKADEDLLETGVEEKRLLRVPNTYGFFSLTGRPWKNLEIFTLVDMTGPMKIKHEGDFDGDDFRLVETPWFARWDINVSYLFSMDSNVFIKPYAGVKNILDSFQNDLDEGADRDAGYIYGPRVPRTFVLGIRGGL
ncbi:MAG: TonB-dependent receptor [bacterium]